MAPIHPSPYLLQARFLNLIAVTATPQRSHQPPFYWAYATACLRRCQSTFCLFFRPSGNTTKQPWRCKVASGAPPPWYNRWTSCSPSGRAGWNKPGATSLGVKMRYTIMVPFFNEQDNVTEMYARTKAAVEAIPDEFEFVFVDDGSTDRTFDILEQIAAV